jgi:hypothetical protein
VLDRDEIGALLLAGLGPATRSCADLPARLERAADGRRLDRHGAAFITSLDAGPPLRDVQEAASYADPRTTMRYDRHRASLDRHATYIVTAHLAGGSCQAELPTGGNPDQHAVVTHCDRGMNANRRYARKHPLGSGSLEARLTGSSVARYSWRIRGEV